MILTDVPDRPRKDGEPFRLGHAKAAGKVVDEARQAMHAYTVEPSLQILRQDLSSLPDSVNFHGRDETDDRRRGRFPPSHLTRNGYISS